MDLKRYEGVIAAAPTLFGADHTVDTAAAEQMAEYLIAGGLSGIFVLSSTGEYFAMPSVQRERMLDAVVRTVQARIPVLAMASDACLETALENIRRIKAHKADAAVLTAPYYYRYSQKELELYFLKAAEASEIPLLLYNQPTRLPVELGEELAERLSFHPNIIGLKDTSADAARLGRMAARLHGRKDFLYYAGSESLAAYAALQDVNFVFALACVEPGLFVGMQKMAKAGDIAGVLEAQRRVEELFGLFRAIGGGSAESFSNFAAGIKAALELKGIGRAYTAQLGRLPSDAEYAVVRAILETRP